MTTKPCRKVRYVSVREAAQSNAPDKHGRIYHCPDCGYYHRGHSRKHRKIIAAETARRRRVYFEKRWCMLINLIDELCGG